MTDRRVWRISQQINHACVSFCVIHVPADLLYRDWYSALQPRPGATLIRGNYQIPCLLLSLTNDVRTIPTTCCLYGQ